MPNEKDVAVFVGSLRVGSFSARVASALADVAPPALRLSRIDIGHLPFYNQDEEARPPAAWTSFRQRRRSSMTRGS